jgi:hypothetical protein
LRSRGASSTIRPVPRGRPAQSVTIPTARPGQPSAMAACASTGINSGTSPGRTSAVRHDLEQLQHPGEAAAVHLQRLADDPVHPAARSACRRGRWAGTEAVSMGDDPVRHVRLGPRLVHTPPEPSGSQRSPADSSGRSFAQVAGAILGKQARGLNPDKDELRPVRRRRELFGAGCDQRASATIPRSSGWWDRLARSPRVARSARRRSPRP